MLKALAGAIVAAIVLTPLVGAQEVDPPSLAVDVSVLRERVVHLEVDQRIEEKVRRRDDRRLARCIAKPTIGEQNACADRFLEWTR